MSITVRKAVSSDMYPVCKLLRESTLNSNWIGVNTRKRMFQDPWSGGEDYFGYVMLDDEAIVGFLGLLFTRQPVNGPQERFCELHSWYVKDAYRKESLKLLLPALSMRKVTLLNYTPTPDVYEISKKFGFTDLETRLRLIYPLFNPFNLRRRYRLDTNLFSIQGRLSEQDKVIFHDHANLDCRHVMIIDEHSGRSCYMIIKRMRRRWFEPFARLLYVSDPDLCAKSIDRWRLKLCLMLRVQCLAIDAAFIGERKIAFSKVIKREVPSLIKSHSELLMARLITPIYSLPLLIGYKLH